jgi:thioredoxin reductase
VVEEAYSNEKAMLGGLKIKNIKTGEAKDLPVSGLFFAIGHEPASKFLNNQVSLPHVFHTIHDNVMEHNSQAKPKSSQCVFEAADAGVVVPK